MVYSANTGRLTLLFLFPGLSGGVGSLGGGLELVFADGVAGCFALVLRSFGPSGAGAGGFRRAGGGAGHLAGAAEPGADLARGHRRWLRGPRLPGQPGDGTQAAGEPQLGEGGDQEPGPAVGGGGVAQQRPGPAELLLEEPEGVLEVEAA